MSETSPIPQTQPTDAAADGGVAGAIRQPAPGIWGRLLGTGNLYILLVLIGQLALFSLISPGHAFFGAGNFLNIVWDSAETLLLAIGETFVIITAGIDLSVGTVLMVSGVVASWVMAQAAGTPAQVASGQFPHADRAIVLGVLAGLLGRPCAGAIDRAPATPPPLPAVIFPPGVFSIA